MLHIEIHIEVHIDIYIEINIEIHIEIDIKINIEIHFEIHIEIFSCLIYPKHENQERTPQKQHSKKVKNVYENNVLQTNEKIPGTKGKSNDFMISFIRSINN